jgi:glutathione S-transferase
MSLGKRYKLYYSARSPFARRIRVALQRLNVDYDPVEINAFSPPSEFEESAPLGTVPALVVRDGKELIVLGDSAAILEYLHDQYGQKIWPVDPAARLRVRAASVLAEGIMTETVRWYIENLRESPSNDHAAEYFQNLDRTLATIHSGSLRGMPWKVSDFQMTQAGYDLFIALDYLAVRMKAYDWAQRYPELARFLELHRSRQDLAPTTPPPV